MRRAPRLKTKLIPAPPGSPRGAFSFAGLLDKLLGLVPKAAAPATYLESTMGLLDQAHSFAQGASNGVASSLTGPVDGLAWLLRKAGVPVPQAPLGGSDWMRNVGLMQEPKERMAGLLGEGIGSALPTVIAGKAPQIANGLLQMERNAMAPRTLNPQTGAIVWHGSPHKFDKFDSSKIGTGEGAQAYGHGLYLAESPDVAKSYLATGQATKAADRPTEMVARAIDASGGDEVAARAWLQNRLSTSIPEYKELYSSALKGFDSLKPQGSSLYKVDLPDDAIAKMLDWDKPLSQQSETVQQAIKKIRPGIDNMASSVNGRLQKAMDQSGEDFVEWMGRGHDSRLMENGIPGIRYLDGGSRASGAGTSNYVVFPGNEGLLKILERNGQGLLGN